MVIKNEVTGKLGTAERQLKKGFRVHRNELLRTGPQAQAELKLDDNTKLAMGPDAELRLDEYAVATRNDTKTIALKFLKGTLRFLTGSNASESYKIETPSATIGIRGTILDGYIAAGGDTFVLLHRGKLEVCSRARACRPHRDVGRVVHATVSGIVSQPMKWTATLVPGVGVAQAFALSYGQVKQLYFQNPAFGFYFLQLISQRLFRDIERLQQRAAHPA